ncbi:MAG: HAD family hydrolase [Bacteroidales bacterium]|nr:HAD family hydrolase [Bacteroidales bacterium]
MPLTLEQYAVSYLPNRGLPWPTAPVLDPPKARPHLTRLPVKAVMWNVYGTLLSIPAGELQFEHPLDFVMDAALDKTIQEFKMWQSMSRKPGAPAVYMKELYNRALSTVRLTGGGEIVSERIWEDIVKKLFQKDYQFDVGIYGSLNEFIQKIAYFFHASIQGTGPYPGAVEAFRSVADAGKVQGLLADGQCFTAAQIVKAMRPEDPSFDIDAVFPAKLRILSAAHKVKKPNGLLFEAALEALRERNIAPQEVLHVGSHIARDIVPAKRAGMRTALFAGDKNSLHATPDQLKDPQQRPDVLLTDLTQILNVVS